MSDINFFTAVSYNNPKTHGQAFREKVDSYFYLGGRKAKVISIDDKSESVKLVDSQASMLTTALKITSYFTIILPLIMLGLKAALRSSHDYVIQTSPVSSLSSHNSSEKSEEAAASHQPSTRFSVKYKEPTDRENRAATVIQRTWRARQTYKKPSDKSKIQQRLNQCDLTCLSANPPLAESQKIDTEKAQLYLELINDEKIRNVAKKVIDHHIMHITMSQFLNALKKSCHKLNLFLAAHPEIKNVSVAYAPTRSQKWVAELALPHLSYFPQEAVNIHPDTTLFGGDFDFDGTNTEFLKKENHALLIFDDCSYSGTQIDEKIIHKLWNQAARIAPGNPNTIAQQHLIFIIPYMTTAAYKKIKEAIKMFDGWPLNGRIKAHIITHGIIPNVTQLPLKKDECKALQQLCNYENSENWKTKSLVFGDWKKPDFFSMPNVFAKGCVPGKLHRYYGRRWEEVPKKYLDTAFIPQVKPPYKN